MHFHFIVNTVSFLDGSMLHWSKHDLERAKQLCNELCLNRGWSIAQNGIHYDGLLFENMQKSPYIIIVHFHNLCYISLF